MSLNSQDKLNENFLDEWLIEQGFPTNVPYQMKLLTYAGYLQLEINKFSKLIPKKTRGAPKKEITKNMLRADKYLSAKEVLIKTGHKKPTQKDVIEFLRRASNILYDNHVISKEDRNLFGYVKTKSIQNKIKQGLSELEKVSKK